MKNKNIQKWITEFLFVVFSVALIGWTASLTLGVMEIVLPNSPYVKYFALALYDGGALTWLFVYIYKAKGTPQRAIAMIMTFLDFLGVVLMVIGALYLGGQTLTEIPTWMGKGLVNGTIAATVFNLGMVYLYHANAPDTREAIQNQDLEDELTEEALLQARASVEREARVLGAVLARRATARLKYRLALPMTEAEAAEWNGETVDATAEDVPALSYSQRHPFWSALQSFFGRVLSVGLPDTPSLKNSTTIQPEAEAPQPAPDETPEEA
ncbi:MAG TPA: hypothetical protein V6C97_32935 [Oculatellaceae cyanobacterium]